jgi:hypothetical protein
MYRIIWFLLETTYINNKLPISIDNRFHSLKKACNNSNSMKLTGLWRTTYLTFETTSAMNQLKLFKAVFCLSIIINIYTQWETKIKSLTLRSLLLLLYRSVLYGGILPLIYLKSLLLLLFLCFVVHVMSGTIVDTNNKKKTHTNEHEISVFVSSCFFLL